MKPKMSGINTKTLYEVAYSEFKDGKLETEVSVCAYHDKVINDTKAEVDRLLVSHTICDECYKEERYNK